MLIMGNQLYHDGEFISFEEYKYDMQVNLDQDDEDIELKYQISQFDSLYDIGYIDAREHYHLIEYAYDEKLVLSTQEDLDV